MRSIGRNKTLRLHGAAKHGFHVPQTIVTSNSHAAKIFINRRPYTIVKSQATIFPRNDQGLDQAYLATKVSSQTPIDYDGLYLAPSIFQQAITPAFDIRVTVVGEDIFAARIDLREVNQHVFTRD